MPPLYLCSQSGTWQLLKVVMVLCLGSLIGKIVFLACHFQETDTAIEMKKFITESGPQLRVEDDCSKKGMLALLLLK